MTTSFTLLNPYDTTIIEGVKQRKPANRECRVYLVLTIGRGQQKRFKTDMSLPAKSWDFSKQQVKPQTGDSVRINGRLVELKRRVMEAYSKLMDSDPKPTFDELVSKLDHVVKTGTLPTPPPEKAPITFFQSFGLFLSFKADNNDNRTRQTFKTLEKALKEYDEQKEKITFESINISFYRSFRSFLHTRNNIMTGKSGYREDTIVKYLKKLKTFMKWSNEEGHHNNIEFRRPEFKTTYKARNEIVTLTPEEIDLLIKHDFSDKPHLDRVRDLFIFLLFTGQRWSDVHAFEPKQVKSGVWEFEAQKTGKPIKIPLIGFAKPAADVLMKYGGDIPKMVDQVFNRSIKEVGRICGINDDVTIKRTIKNRITFITKPKCEFMSSHMGRRTLVTLLANKGVALTTIQEITGHEDIKTLIKYKKQDPDLIREAFEKVVEDEANEAAMQSLLKALANNADPEMMKEILEKLAAAQGNRKLRAV